MRYALALFLLAPSTAHAQIITGPAEAVDGDSLNLSDTRVRLLGIDAPEGRQTCKRGGATWNCGEEAAALLRSLVRGRAVTCEGRDTDPYGRLVAVCKAGGIELAGAMIEAGMAVALPQFSDAYLEGEARVRRHRVGIWGSEFEMPAAYRAAHRSPAEQRPRQMARGVARAATSRAKQFAGGCVIKGNRNRKGQWIYHLPGMPYYDETRPEEIFCSEAKAVAAGYRRAIVRP